MVHFNINRLVEPVVAARLLGIPSVMHFRDIPSRNSSHFVLGRRAFYGLMNMTDHWIANSHATKLDICAEATCPVTVIWNGLDLEAFDSKTAIAGAREPNTHTVAMVAGLQPWKNQRDYVRLARLVLATRDDAVFLVVGSGSAEYKAELQRTAALLGVADQVRFMGFVDNIPSLMSTIDVLVHTTDREPFGRVFVEAMAARKPIVAVQSGGPAEIVVHGETGFLVPSGDLEAMAGAVTSLLDDPAARLQMGDAGRRRVERHYTLQRHCAAVAHVYETVEAKQC
jgi:glycosyltransferase involved in cell wall biosynthesis